jgi:hypothetical protein
MNVRISVLLIALGFILPSIAHSQTFQQRSAVEKDKVATFAVRNPNGQIKYKAAFVVTTPDKKQYEREKDGINDEWLEVVFPIDFDVKDVEPGQYEWKCLINKKVVAFDHFNVK